MNDPGHTGFLFHSVERYNEGLVYLALFALFSIFVSLISRNILFIHGLSIFWPWSFFCRRFDFLRYNLKRNGVVFHFKVLSRPITVVSGEAWRKRFFTNKEFEVQEASTVLNCFPPEIVSSVVVGYWDPDHAASENSLMSKRLSAIMQGDILVSVLPKVFSDLERLMQGWGSTGTFWPFDDLFNIVVHISIRLGACAELASDHNAASHYAGLYWTFMKSNTAKSVLLARWKGNSGRLRKLTQMTQTIHDYVQDRADSGMREEDAVQVLSDRGDNVAEITQFIVMLLIAGVPNTATMTAWLPYFLHLNQIWKTQVIAEVRSLLAQHAASLRHLPLSAQLASLPPSAWTSSMPILDACLRETIRIVSSTTLMRRNRGGPVKVDGDVVDAGSYVLYQASDVHMEENIYRDAAKFNPGRYSKAKGEGESSTFLGWGAGQHPCLGMVFAKVEIKCIIAFFLLQFDYDLVDKRGKTVSKIPCVDRNHLNFNPPLGEKVYIRYKRNGDLQQLEAAQGEKKEL